MTPGGSLRKSAGVPLPNWSSVTTLNQYSPSCDSRQANPVWLGAARSFSIHSPLAPSLVQSWTSRMPARARSSIMTGK